MASPRATWVARIPAMVTGVIGGRGTALWSDACGRVGLMRGVAADSMSALAALSTNTSGNYCQRRGASPVSHARILNGAFILSPSYP